MQTHQERVEIINAWEKEYAPKNLLNIPANIELLNSFRFRGKTIQEEISVEALVAAVDALRDKLYFAVQGQGQETKTPVKEDLRSRFNRLADVGIAANTGRATPESRAEDDRKAKALADNLKSDVNLLQRKAAYRKAVADAEAEASMLPHSKRPGRLEELMAKIGRDFPDIA